MNIANLTAAQIKRLSVRLTYEIDRLGKDYTIIRQKWKSDGANGKLPDGTEGMITFKGLLGNLTTTQIRTISTDGGREYNITHYVLTMCKPDICFKVGDTFSNDNMLYEVAEYFDVADLGLYWFVSLTATMKESDKYG